MYSPAELSNLLNSISQSLIEHSAMVDKASLLSQLVKFYGPPATIGAVVYLLGNLDF